MRMQIKLSGSNLQVFWQSSEVRPFKARWAAGRGDWRQRNYTSIARLESFVGKDARYAMVAREKRAAERKMKSQTK